MSDAPIVTATARQAANVTGYVEAMTLDAALGWAWQPGSAARLRIQLRRGIAVVAETIADGMRSDLAQSGIGDGKHAFAVPIPETMRKHAAGLKIVAILEDGSETPLAAPPATGPEATRIEQLQKSVDMLVASQRLIHRNLQAALLQQSPSGTLAEIAAAQTSLRQAIETVELFAIRLEQRSTPIEPQDRPAASNRLLAVVAGTAAVALLASIGALAHSLSIG